MADKPKLIGIIRLRIPKLTRQVVPGVDEMIQSVAFDSEGHAWGLVERLTKLDPGIKTSFLRLSFHRFQRLADIPFDDTSRVEWFEREAPEGM